MSEFTVLIMSPQRSTTHCTRRALPWRPLLILSVVAFITVTTELLPASLLVELSDGLNVSERAAGLLVAGWALTVAAASIPLVRLTARVPRRHVLPSALLVSGLATAGTALAPTYASALASRIVAAAAHGLFWSLLVATAASLVPLTHIGRAISVVLAGPALAGVVGIPLGAVIGAHVGWRYSFGLLALLLAAASIAVRLLTLQDPPGDADQDRRRDPAAATVLALAVAGGLVITGHFTLYTYVSPLLQVSGGYDAGTCALLPLAFGLAGLAGIALSDRLPRHALVAVSAGFAAAAASLALLGAGLPAAVLAMTLWGSLIGLLPPVFQTRLLRTASPGKQATAGAVGVTVLNLGIAAGASLGGLTLHVLDVRALPAVAAGVILVAVAAGSEPFRGIDDAQVLDFWRFALSDVRMNNVRGYFPEFLVYARRDSAGSWPVPHLKIRCVAGHWYLLSETQLPGPSPGVIRTA